MLVLGQGLRLGAHVAPEGGEALDSCSARGTGCFDRRMLMVLECFHVILTRLLRIRSELDQFM